MRLHHFVLQQMVMLQITTWGIIRIYVFFIFSEPVLHSLLSYDTVLLCFFSQPFAVCTKPLWVRLRTTAHYAASTGNVNNEL